LNASNHRHAALRRVGRRTFRKAVACSSRGADANGSFVPEIVISRDRWCKFSGFHIARVPIRYTVGGGKGVERRELIIFGWDDAAQPAELF
ncbi:hypothetical protein, partial [Burkholderia pseudomallei]|uniref:hypothetical protein n=1 Tax=Burkholderia pseudomallei TaxID=28450 RepID=UPI002116945E